MHSDSVQGSRNNLLLSALTLLVVVGLVGRGLYSLHSSNSSITQERH